MAGFLGVSPDSTDERKHRRQIAGVVNELLKGKTNNTASVTLAVSATTTTFTNSLLSIQSVLLFAPRTPAAVTAAPSLYTSTKTNGVFTLTHASNASATQTFDVVIIG